MCTVFALRERHLIQLLKERKNSLVALVSLSEHRLASLLKNVVL